MNGPGALQRLDQAGRLERRRQRLELARRHRRVDNVAIALRLGAEAVTSATTAIARHHHLNHIPLHCNLLVMHHDRARRAWRRA